MAPFTKTSKSQAIKGLSKGISITTNMNFFILVTSSGNKHQRDYRFTDSFYTKNFQMSKRNRLQANRNFPVLMMPIRQKHQLDFGLMVGSFHKNLKIHVNNSLNRDNQRSNKHKFPCFEDVIAE